MSDDDEGILASHAILDTIDAKYAYKFTVAADYEFDDDTSFGIQAVVTCEGVRVGGAWGYLVNRARTQHSSGWDFFEVCDAASEELCNIANDFCGNDSYGRLVRDIVGLSSTEHARASKGGFLHISLVKLEAAHRGADIGLRCLHALLSWLATEPAGKYGWTIAVLFPAPDPCDDPDWRMQQDKEQSKEEKEKAEIEHQIGIQRISAQWSRLGFVRKSAKSSFSYLLPSRLTLQPRPKDLWIASFGSAVSAGAISQDIFGRLSAELSSVVEGERLALIESQLQRLRAGELDGMLSAKQNVRLVGLAAKPELNGAPGIIVSFVPDKGRFAVQLLTEAALPKGPPICVKPANIEPANAVFGITGMKQA